MSTCYLCNKFLSDSNRTEEHIFLNALGGRLTSKELICRACNSGCGNSTDGVLAKSLLVFAHNLNVRRDDGKDHPKLEGRLEATGDPILISADGNAVLLPQKPKITHSADGKSVNIQIKASDEKIAREQLTGLKRTFPNLDVEASIASAQKNLTEPGGRYSHAMAPLGGPDAERSMSRSLVSFYLLQNGDRRFVKHLFPLIRGESEWRAAPIGLYFPKHEPFALQDDEITHSLVVIGRPEDKILFGHIEYFNVASYLLILNEDYSGPAFQASYVFDLETGSEIQVSARYSDLSNEEIQRICDRRSLEQEDLDGWASRMNSFSKKLEVIKAKRRVREFLLNRAPEFDFTGISGSDMNIIVDYFYRGGLTEHEARKQVQEDQNQDILKSS